VNQIIASVKYPTDFNSELYGPNDFSRMKGRYLVENYFVC
jgi:hypothetical protein